MNNIFNKRTILASLFSLLMLIGYAEREKVVQIFRGGEVVQEYAISDIDYIEVNDRRESPSKVEAEVDEKSITITWNAVEGATYNIYRSADNVNFTLLAKDLKETSYTDSEPLSGSNFYKVKAIVDGQESAYTQSAAASFSDTELPSGVYLGITGFNQSLMEYPVHSLTKSSVTGFNDFIDGLEMKNGTILYHSFDKALDALQASNLPEDLTTAAIITFTDGLDQGSFMMNPAHANNDDYLKAMNKRIKEEKVFGKAIEAYSIGLKGSDVKDDEAFTRNLQQLASSPANATELNNMDEVNARFREIAEQLTQSSYIQAINLTIPGLAMGTRVRFTFDNVGSADKSNLYIEGSFNLTDCSLEDVKYVGLTSTSGTVVKGNVDGIFVTFTFDNVHTDTNTLIRSSYIDEWNYIETNSSWQINSEFDKTENSDIVTNRSSAAIMLVLDCSSSLKDDFIKAQKNAKDFIKTLLNATVEKPFKRRMVLEENCGVADGWCIRAIYGVKTFFEELKNVGEDDNFIVIDVHNYGSGADPMFCKTYESWSSKYNINASPQGTINRINTFLGFDPSLENLREIFPKINIGCNEYVEIQANFDTDNENVIAETTMKFAESLKNANYGLSYVLVQNEIGPYYQSNFYSGGQSGEMGGYENLSSIVPQMYNHVAREICNWEGDKTACPSEIIEGEEYVHIQKLSLEKCKTLNNESLSNVEVVVLLINCETGEIANAAKCKVNG